MLPLDAAVARAREALGSAGEVSGGSSEDTPRYELFNAAKSICSQKVRCVLAHHNLVYVNHPVDLFLGQTYLPDYVRLRVIGCQQLGGPLAAHHSGDTSTSTGGGCDGAVVPTLIDHAEHRVLVDSRLICLHLDSQVPIDRSLRPASLADRIDEQLAIVDSLPNYQLLMGRKPTDSEGGATRTDVGGNFSMRKVAWCDRYLDEHRDEEVLVQAYAAKRAKELSAAEGLFSAEAMDAAYARAEHALQTLDATLRDSAGPWLFGPTFTMADLFWGVELLRTENMGVGMFWEGSRLPAVKQLLFAAHDLPSIRAGVTDWPEATF